jgi:hypothetical protein
MASSKISSGDQIKSHLVDNLVNKPISYINFTTVLVITPLVTRGVVGLGGVV